MLQHATDGEHSDSRFIYSSLSLLATPGCTAAANAFVKRQLGPAYSARLVGVKDMPRAATHLSLDFSSLLGPLFSMWLLQVGTEGGGSCMGAYPAWN